MSSDVPQQPARPVLPNEIEQKLSLREYEQRHEALRIWVGAQFNHIKEITEIRADALETALKLQAASAEKALELQAIEYARRLEELNHAHKIAMDNWARSLPREMFDQATGEWQKWRDATSEIALVLQQDVKNLAKDVATIENQIASKRLRIENLERGAQNVVGAMNLMRFMGFAGVVALLISLLRMAGLLH